MICSFFFVLFVLLLSTTHTLIHVDPSIFVLHRSHAKKLILTDILTRKVKRSSVSIFDHTSKSFTTRSFFLLLSYSFFHLAEGRNWRPQQRRIFVGNYSIWKLVLRFGSSVVGTGNSSIGNDSIWVLLFLDRFFFFFLYGD
ncbi:hypothetical protein ACB098_08G016500 [Castanea mollissima]